MLRVERISDRSNTYLMEESIFDTRTMADTQVEKKEFADEELEDILSMHKVRDQVSVAEVRELIRENPLLVAGLVFTFGLLVGVSLSSGKRK